MIKTIIEKIWPTKEVIVKRLLIKKINELDSKSFFYKLETYDINELIYIKNRLIGGEKFIRIMKHIGKEPIKHI